MNAKVILTFDLEEFDLPLEHQIPISEKEQFDVANEGLKKLLILLNRHEIKATFFTTGNFCKNHPTTMKLIAEKHEIASHAYFHSQFNEEYIVKSKQTIEAITGKKVKGFRMPLLQKIDYNALKHAGYEYDTSMNPTFIPGRYNNFRKPRKPYTITNVDITEFPVSVSPLIRFPLFWLSFKNLPFFLYRFLCFWTLKQDTYIHLYFHPWEFAKIDEYKIPKYIITPNGERYSSKFEKLLNFLKNNGEFYTVAEFLESIKQ